MINTQLSDPKSIVVVGGSNDIQKPGGKVLKNLLDGNYKGKLYVTNIKEDEVQGIKSYKNIHDLPDVELAIIAIAARYTFDAVKVLTEEKQTRAFIILSAGFSEVSEEGKQIEKDILYQINKFSGALIGPNCIGICTPSYHGIFTEPIPKLDPKGCDLISASGATACYIMESGLEKGLSFAEIISLGNSAQMGVEEVVRHLDMNHDETKSTIKLLYIENVKKPQMLMKHAASLIRKGCRIAAIKAGSSEAGSRAASSHTGALASSDEAVNAIFRKAGIIRCDHREELIAVASVFMHPQLIGKNIAIITHAGGPAVMLTDALSNGGLFVPAIHGPEADALKERLHPGSSVTNPIDFLATGTAAQLADIINTMEQKFDHIDAMIVIFGTPGLFKIHDVYEVLHEKMRTCKKPIFPVLPSTYTAKEEVEAFIAKGRINFPDEVILGKALAKVYTSPKPQDDERTEYKIDREKIRVISDNAKSGYLSPEEVQGLLDAVGIPRANEAVVNKKEKAIREAEIIGYPLVMKVVGPVHKSDVGGVVLNVETEKAMLMEFERMMQIKETTGILLQPMLSGTELFVGAKKEVNFGHMILCGLGGIFIEVLKDIKTGLAPLSFSEALNMINGLRGIKIIDGVRGQEGIDKQKFAEIIVRVSQLVSETPIIEEMDLNPLLGSKDRIIAVDARIRVDKG
ncbi:MAG: acetate--CoA ligase family protein [Bacteroidales bacterium]|nr:acetate--CoA ligase family protein [Bacteroidales bacterium]MCF8404307.1 acetate--CoA ligase family protein [Bacteroidales bacterium]